MKRLKNRPFLMIILFALSSPSTARDTITPGKPLLDNETLISSGENFALGFFTPSGSSNRYIGVWYNKITVQTIVWVANRNNPVVNSTATLSVTTNGRLAITDQSSTIVWSTPATSLANPVAQLLDSGNLVVKEETGTSSTSSFAWQGFDYPTDTMIPGMKLGTDLTTGLTRNLTAWKGANDPSPSRYCLAMDVAGDPEMVLLEGSTKVWRSGRWDGFGFSGISSIFKDNATYHGFNFSVVNNHNEVSFSFTMSEPGYIYRAIVAPSGIMEVGVWVRDRGWNYIAYAPRDPCDNIGQCGPFGACDPYNVPICECLPGFTPKKPTNWALQNGRDGCVRERELECRNGTDRFVNVSNMKLPARTNSLLQLSLSLEQCKALCLLNCSCMAYASAQASKDGSGCLFWFTELTDIKLLTNAGSGQDLYLRLAAADQDSPLDAHNTRGMAFAIWVTIVVVIVVFASLSGLGFYLWRGKKMKMDGRNVVQNEDDFELPVFDFKSISAATNNFSISNKLGEGGFGPVYKGKLGQDQDIAVKRLAMTSNQGSDEFRTEVMLIAKLQHRNLVRLLGCCIQGDERMLIYEYMPNKSLDVFIFEKEQSVLLDWQTRYNIILGIARGLLYLHQDSRFRIIHRDLKANNILLDKEMNPKISDFGLARISREDESETNTRRIVGTYGYMSPEYAMNGIFSVKSDVYSFGVLVLEIISGKKNRGLYASSPYSNLVIHMWDMWSEGNVTEVVDESMGKSFPMEDVLKCIKIGLLCVQERPEYRPLMPEVILMLRNGSAPLPEPKEPGFIVRRGPAEVHSASSKQPGSNGLTITMFEVGR